MDIRTITPVPAAVVVTEDSPPMMTPMAPPRTPTLSPPTALQSLQRRIKYVARAIFIIVTRTLRWVYRCFSFTGSRISNPPRLHQFGKARDQRTPPRPINANTVRVHSTSRRKLEIETATLSPASSSTAIPPATRPTRVNSRSPQIFGGMDPLQGPKPIQELLLRIAPKVADEIIAANIEPSLEAMKNFEPTWMPNFPQKLAIAVRATISNNIEFITEMFAERITELTTNLSFSQAFDKIVHDIIYDTIKAQIDAEKEVVSKKESLENTKNRIQDLLQKIETKSTEVEVLTGVIEDDNSSQQTREHGAKMRAKMDQELVAMRLVLNIEQDKVQEVQDHGDENAYFEHVFLDTFARVPATLPGKAPPCSERIRELTSDYIAHRVQKNIEAAKEALKNSEHEIYTALTNRIVNLLLPKQLLKMENGSIQEVEFIEAIWAQLNYPEELFEILRAIKRMTLAPDDTAKQMIETSQGFIKVVFEAQVKKMLHQAIYDVVKSCCQQFVEPEKLDKVLAEKIFPNANELLMRQIINRLLRTRVEEVTAIFYTHLTAEKRDEPRTLERLYRYIMHHLEKICTCENSKRYLDVYGPHSIKNEIKQICQEIESFHRTHIDSTHDEGRIFRLAGIRAFLTQHDPHVIADPVFGNLAFDLVFDIGMWPLKGTITSLLSLKGSLSASMTAATADIRNSHDYFSRELAKALKKIVINNARQDAAGAGVVVVVEPGSLQEEIATTASIIYDMVLFKSTDPSSLVLANWTSYYSIKWYLGGSDTEIAKLIERIYKKTFHREIVNLNLVARVGDAFLEALEKHA